MSLPPVKKKVCLALNIAPSLSLWMRLSLAMLFALLSAPCMPVCVYGVEFEVSWECEGSMCVCVCQGKGVYLCVCKGGGCVLHLKGAAPQGGCTSMYMRCT